MRTRVTIRMKNITNAFCCDSKLGVTVVAFDGGGILYANLQ